MAIKAASSTDRDRISVNRIIPQSEYQQRRQHLTQQMADKSVAMLFAAPETLRNADSHQLYRQNSDFYYLTGFEEADAVVVIIKDGAQRIRMILFVRERDPEKELWDGPRAGVQGAKSQYGADDAYPISEFLTKLPEILTNQQQIYLPLGQNEPMFLQVLQQVNVLHEKARSGVQAPQILHNIRPLIAELRLFKSAKEVEAMQRACDITVKGHKRAMRAVQAGFHEYELEARLHYEFYRGGSRHAAYTSIVGGGANSCILHYVANNAILREGDLVLIDAGAEFENYAADVTRTFPVSGKFSEEQKQIYELVYHAQMAAIAEIKPGVLWTRMQDVIVEIIVDGLLALGLLRGSRQTLINDQAYRRFYMHRSGHWLGLDVHDVGTYTQADGTWRTLQPGMVLTVEPGIYIPANSPDVDDKWWNIGVRIEDDVVVTETGALVMTEAAPKSVKDIEAYMSDKS